MLDFIFQIGMIPNPDFVAFCMLILIIVFPYIIYKAWNEKGMAWTASVMGMSFIFLFGLMLIRRAIHP